MPDGVLLVVLRGKKPEPHAGDYLDAFFSRFGIEIDYAGTGNG